MIGESNLLERPRESGPARIGGGKKYLGKMKYLKERNDFLTKTPSNLVHIGQDT